MCSSQAPWAINDNLAYGFTSVGSTVAKCCTCYQLSFTSGPVAGKKMIVQATNTGTDVGATQFDLAVRLFYPESVPTPPMAIGLGKAILIEITT